MLTSLGLIRNFEEQKKFVKRGQQLVRKLDIHLVKNIHRTVVNMYSMKCLCCLMFIAGLWRGGLVRPGEAIGAVGEGRGISILNLGK